MVCPVRSRRLFLWMLCTGAALTVSTGAQSPDTYPQKTRTFHSSREFAQATGGTVTIHRTLDPSERASLLELSIRLPTTEFTVIRAESPTVTWIGTRQGAIRLSRDHQAVEYFAGKRWLPDDHVTGIGVRRQGDLDRDAQGVRADRVHADDAGRRSHARSSSRVQARHNRWGLTADSHLRVPGDLSTNQMVSSDNDGLWTAMYVAAECFRYKVTGEADARDERPAAGCRP